MAINPARTFGSRNTAPAAKAELEKAQFWINIGYVSDVKDDDGTHRFVSLAKGIPLDSLEDLPVNSRNEGYAYFQQARNDLRKDLLEECRKLAPGEDFIFDAEPGQITIQMRRVSDENTSAPTGVNPFARKS